MILILTYLLDILVNFVLAWPVVIKYGNSANNFPIACIGSEPLGRLDLLGGSFCANVKGIRKHATTSTTSGNPQLPGLLKETCNCHNYFRKRKLTSKQHLFCFTPSVKIPLLAVALII